jgi:hypothetical protein
MNRNISIIQSTGEPAKNLHGSCAVLALSNIIGMSYEQATAWTVKNRLAYRVVKQDGIEHVAGTTFYQGEGYRTYKKLRPNCEITRYLKPSGYDYYVNKAGQDGRPTIEENLKGAQADKFAKNIKISTFIKNNPRGRFLILTRDHALALINGVLYNNNNENGWYTNQIVNYTVKF